MADEVKYRELLEHAQKSTEHVEAFLVAISDAAAGDLQEIKGLVVQSRQQLQGVRDGMDRLWDVFKRRQ